MTEENTPAPEAGTTPESVQIIEPAGHAAPVEVPSARSGSGVDHAGAGDTNMGATVGDRAAEPVITDEAAAADALDAETTRTGDQEAAPAEVPAEVAKAVGKAPAPTEGERIAKVIARVGLASRRVAEKMILDGRVKVNGKVIDSPALDIGPRDKVVVDGKPLDAPQDTRLWLYYKPAGLVTTESDELGRRTIYDELPEDLPRVMTVGRLDLNSEGLLLLTNDGELKRRLELPATGWLRRYKVRVNGRPTTLTFDPLRRGAVIGGEEFAPMEISLDSQRGDNAWLTIGIREGRNREIRRAMEHVGLIVNRLIRLSYGPFRLTTMKEGEVAEVRRRILRDQLGPLLPGNEDAEADARPTRGRRPGPGGRPVRGAEGERPARKPFAARGEDGDRPGKPFGRRSEGEDFRGEGARKPFGRRGEDGGAPASRDGDGARKPYARRAGDGADGARKPYPTRDGEAPRKSYTPRDGQAGKPYGRSEGGDGSRQPYATRDGENARKPYAARDGERRKPYASRNGEGARKPYGSGDGAKPYGRADGDGPRRPYAPRDGEGARKPYAPRPEAEGEAPRKPRHKAGAPRGEGFGARPARDDATPRKPYAPRDSEARKPYGQRDGEGRKPYASRDGEAARKPYAARDGEGGRKPYGSRDGEGAKKYGRPDGDGPRRPYAPRPEAAGDASHKPRHKAGAPRGEGFGARDDGAPRKPYAPRREGQGFKPRGEGKPGGFGAKSGGQGKPGGFKPRGDRPTGGKPGPRKGPARQG